MDTEQWTAAAKDASLGVGHIWTNQSCPAYDTLNGKDCDCNQPPERLNDEGCTPGGWAKSPT